MAPQRIVPGFRVTSRQLAALDGTRVQVPDPQMLVHLQFRRFAGCPVCNLHLRSFTQRHEEIAAANVREIVFFHSAEDELRPHVTGLPFVVVADPDKRYYHEFGVEAGIRALLDRRAWRTIARAIAHSLREGLPLPSLFPRGGRYGLPADFLIASDGRVCASHYGDHADDQWSVDDVLALARAE